jgi:hypothetical protein
MFKTLGQEKSVGGDAQRGMVMKTAPTTSLEMGQPKLLLEFLVIALGAPTHLGGAHELFERGLGGQRGQPILDRFAVSFRPFDEQPFLLTERRTPVVAMRGAHPYRREARRQVPVVLGVAAEFAATIDEQAQQRHFMLRSGPKKLDRVISDELLR